MATFQPARAKRRARALPRPLAPPVMAMRWLGKRFMVSSCCFCFTPLSRLGRGVGGEGPGFTCKTEPSELYEHSRPLPVSLSPEGEGAVRAWTGTSELHEHSRPLPVSLSPEGEGAARARTGTSELHEHSRPLPVSLSPEGEGAVRAWTGTSELYEHSRPLPVSLSPGGRGK